MFRTVVCIVAAFGVSTAFGKGYSPAVTAQPGGYAVKFASNGTPLAVPVSTLPGGLAGATGPAPITLPGGIVYPAIATAALAAGALLGPWAAVIGIGVAAGSLGIAALDVALDAAKIRFRPGGIVEKSDPSVCTVAPCIGYMINGRYPTTTVYSTFSAACAAFAADISTNNPNYNASVIGSSVTCDVRLVSKSTGAYVADQSGGVYSVSVEPSPAAYVATTLADAAAVMALRTPTAAEVQGLVDLNFPPELAPPTMTGPASVFKGNTVQLGLDGTVKEIEERYIASFQPGLIQIGVEKKETITSPGKQSTSITTNPDGSTSSAVISTPRVTATLTTSSPLEQPAVTCGLPGTPACRMDESGTPAAVPENQFKPLVDKNKADADAARLTIAGTADKPFFSGWSSLFFLPPVVACAPFELPRSMGAIDPCPVADGMRSVMAWIWAAGGLFLCLGMIKKVV